MGTNYYIERPETCPCCERRLEEDYHIGKSSCGWTFALHVDPENGINDLDDIKKMWKDHRIYDEHGRTISEKEMLGIILDRLKYCIESQPDRLYRRTIGNGYCIGHGKGSYDLCIG